MPVISGVKTDAITIGKSTTDSQNFQLSANNDGSAKLARGSDGSLGDILTVASDGKVTLASGETLTSSKLQSATAQASTSGTSIDFTGIPSWVKRITVMLQGVSTNGSSLVQIQLGDSGGIENTGYSSAASTISATVASAGSTTGFILLGTSASTVIFGGIVTLTLMDTNLWSMCFAGGRSDATTTVCAGGWKTLSGTLDRIRITTVNGTDTFDAGSINIMWE
jgi:hypothetical protein